MFLPKHAALLLLLTAACQSGPSQPPPTVTVDLIYGPTCPNSAAAYRTLQKIQADWGTRPGAKRAQLRVNRWRVPENALPTPATVRLNGYPFPADSSLPVRLSGYSSPTVLVAGHSVTGTAPQPGLPGCAVLLPTERLIREAIDAALPPAR
ncbi:hypothetical protein [Hymenobacter jeollabukensis]|uniref:Uncharacterized protein n=1 Tax=Hymenobacter jeollabukensis TaxID=2025313 RepID=A0A5R8WLX2_9BACT|nr:hypothetical protein [Hymenobacter jeollabukensis]TLM90416.1 hypothetical protein FDY95_16980 [Hymenobacter jeollabukensis]